jgi:hypothetical protein
MHSYVLYTVVYRRYVYTPTRTEHKPRCDYYVVATTRKDYYYRYPYPSCTVPRPILFLDSLALERLDRDLDSRAFQNIDINFREYALNSLAGAPDYDHTNPQLYSAAGTAWKQSSEKLSHTTNGSKQPAR